MDKATQPTLNTVTGCLLYCQTFSRNCTSLYYILKPGYDLLIRTRITAAAFIRQRRLLNVRPLIRAAALIRSFTVFLLF